MDCHFCRIAAGELNADILYDDGEVLAFRDINPVAPHHILIIPRRHIATVNDMGTEDAPLIGRLHLAARQLAEEQGFAEQGYRLTLNCGRDGGQTVFHVHLHLMGGRHFHWPPG
jgi:histidine triad (HIT) family protein